MSASPETLSGRIIGLHRSLRDAELVHAFGGALALAYCTNEPRATRDIDVNVFVSPSDVVAVLAGLPGGVDVTEKNERQLARDGQSRLWWDDTPVDIFLSNHSFHDVVRENRRFVPFAGVDDLPVLACGDLAVFKSFFGRAKDAIDIAAMVAVEAVDLRQLRVDVAVLLGDGEQRNDFFALVEAAIPDYASSSAGDPVSFPVAESRPDST